MHFLRMFEAQPRDLDAARRWESSKIKHGVERMRIDPNNPASRTVVTARPDSIDADKDPVGARARAFRNVMEAYVAYMAALSRAVVPGMMTQEQITAYAAAGAPELPPGIAWANVDQPAREAVLLMTGYGGNEGVGLNYRDIPDLYERFMRSIQEVASQAMTTRGKSLRLPSADASTLPSPAWSPEMFMAQATRAMSEYAEAMVKKDYEKQRELKTESRQRRDAMRQAADIKKGQAVQKAVSKFEGMDVESFMTGKPTAQEQKQVSEIWGFDEPGLSSAQSTAVVEETGSSGTLDPGAVASAFDFEFNPRGGRFPSRRSTRGR